MNQKTRMLFLFLVGAFAGMLAMYLYNNYTVEKKNPEVSAVTGNSSANSAGSGQNPKSKASDIENSAENSIEKLTEESNVIGFVKANHQLPAYYITKNEARKRGWVASEGNLCEVLPGKAIGGDRFSNREKQLPKGAQYYEADVNYTCGRRNADRIIFTENGEVWLTKNHYKTFEKQ